ncbi:unnamed protein product [Ilex paraguariensis]|uniref:Uncharacterized protein n=1 Tax=Ilex paraguariensis TaxID=185542 RepID=A0ABC8SU97_9AQUA
MSSGRFWVPYRMLTFGEVVVLSQQVKEIVEALKVNLQQQQPLVPLLPALPNLLDPPKLASLARNSTSGEVVVLSQQVKEIVEALKVNLQQQQPLVPLLPALPNLLDPPKLASLARNSTSGDPSHPQQKEDTLPNPNNLHQRVREKYEVPDNSLVRETK